MYTPLGPQVHLRFRRYECKYLVTEGQAANICRYVEPYVEPDPFAARRPDGCYEISSLYFDTPKLRLYGETLGGIRDRFKLRIRAYSDRMEDPVFFEVKTRRDRVIMKARSRVRRGDMMQVVAGGGVSADHMPPEEREHFGSFMTRLHALDAGPIVLVRYVRQALHGVFDPSVRVTFDRQLRCLATTDASLFFERQGWDLVEGRRVIVEFKFTGQCPQWIANAIRRVGLDRISYSKYAHSVDATTRRAAMGM